MAILTAQNRVIDWTNPNAFGGGLPGFIEVPVFLKQEPGKTEMCASLDLWFSCYPVRTWDGLGHGIAQGTTPPSVSVQHLFSGQELWRVPQDKGVTLPEGTRNTMWVNPGVNIDPVSVEAVQGSPRIGAMWMTEQNPSGGGRFSPGFGWIHCVVQKFPRGFSAAEMNIPCEGLVATIWVRTGGMYPLPVGLYAFHTGFALDNYRRTSCWAYDSQFMQPAEVPLIHKPTYLYIRHPEWKPILGVIKPTDPDFPFEELQLTPEDLMAQ